MKIIVIRNEIKRELCFSKVSKELEDGTFKPLFMWIIREFVREDTLEKHIKNTCKIRKIKNLQMKNLKNSI